MDPGSAKVRLNCSVLTRNPTRSWFHPEPRQVTPAGISSPLSGLTADGFYHWGISGGHVSPGDLLESRRTWMVRQRTEDL